MIKSVYIHIPFCSSICSYCDFPKLYYNKCWIDKYLISLNKEIEKRYKGEILDTIYIGGGTPSSLNLEELKKLFEILNKFKLNKNYEFTIECNLENLTEEKLLFFKNNKVNRLSIGIQTFNQKYLDFLNRKTCDTKLIEYAKSIGFDNINVDLIYAIPNQTLEELDKDLDRFLELNINHISTYSLMIEPHTVLGNNNIESINEELDYEMYKLICKKLKDNGYHHYEVSNFARNNYESKHNLTYWNNQEYYGFGMGASGYIKNIRYTNTKSITKYINGSYDYEQEEVTRKLQMEYEMILGLRKMTGVNMLDFKDKYQKNIEEVYNIEKLLKEGKLIKDNNNLKISDEYLYLSNEILINFVGEV